MDGPGPVEHPSMAPAGREEDGSPMSAISTNDLLHALFGVTSASDARALMSRATRVAGVPSNRPLETRELLMVCEALAAEGGVIQQIAEQMAVRALR
jgi:hypothetical protein